MREAEECCDRHLHWQFIPGIGKFQQRVRRGAGAGFVGVPMSLFGTNGVHRGSACRSA